MAEEDKGVNCVIIILLCVFTHDMFGIGYFYFIKVLLVTTICQTFIPCSSIFFLSLFLLANCFYDGICLNFKFLRVVRSRQSIIFPIIEV